MPESEDEGLGETDNRRQRRGTRVATEDSGQAKISKDGARSTYSEGKSLLVVVVICESEGEVWMRIGVRIAEAFA